MSDPLTGAGALLGAGLWQWLVVFFRVAALVSVLPAFGERSIPARVKLAVAVVFTLVVAPAAPIIAAPATASHFAAAAAGEVLVGLALGMFLRMFVLALQTAGSIAAQSTSLSQIFGGAVAEPLPAMGYLLVLAGLTLAVIAHLHVRVAEFLILSYRLFPAGTGLAAADLASWASGHVARLFALAFALASPFVIASLIYNLALGAINRAMPQLMVAFVGAPLITFGGLFLMLVGAPLIIGVWTGALFEFLSDPTGQVR